MVIFSSNLHRKRLLLTSVAILALANCAVAAENGLKKPAVSDINARIEGAFGAENSLGFGQLAGAITMPLGERFGIQVDGIVRFGNADTTIGGAAHLFWRDPDLGLLGLYASYMQFGAASSNVTRVGVEAEAYFGDFSLIGVGGWQQSDVAGVKDTSPFADIDFAYYPTDETRLTAGYRFDGTDSFGVVGAEYKFLSNASAKVEGQFGENSSRVWAGLTFHIGGNDPDKSLKGRQREDDPTIWMTRQNAPAAAAGGGGGGPACFEAQNRFGPPQSPAPYLICPAGVTPPTNTYNCREVPGGEEGPAYCYNPSPMAGELLCNVSNDE